MTSPGAFWTRWRVPLGYPVALAALLLSHPTPRAMAFGVVVSLFGLLVRAWAAGHLRKHLELSCSGPYSLTRNPLYVGSLILAAGFLIAGRSWFAALLFALYFLVFYPAVMRREEAELRAQYGAAYDDYARRVPLFLPALGRRMASSTSFSRALYLRNREYQAAFGFLVGMALLGLRLYWHWPWS